MRMDYVRTPEQMARYERAVKAIVEVLEKENYTVAEGGMLLVDVQETITKMSPVWCSEKIAFVKKE